MPALLLTAAYVIAVAVTAGIALTGGDIGPLERLTVLKETDDGDGGEPTLRDVIAGLSRPSVGLLLAVGAVWTWTLWQSLRGPSRPPPGAARHPAGRDERRLRLTLYVVAGTWVVYAAAPIWPWWAVVLDATVLAAVVVALHPVLRQRWSLAGFALAAGLLGYVTTVAGEVFYALDLHDWERAAQAAGLGGLAGTLWYVLVLAAQWRDGRWRRATVLYGVAAQVLPLLLVMFVALLPARVAGVDLAAYAVMDAMIVIWLARSAHDLAAPQPAPSHAPSQAPSQATSPARPPGLAPEGPAPLVRFAGFAACVSVLIPPLISRDPLWLTRYLPLHTVQSMIGEPLSLLWRGFEAAVGLGGLAVVVLTAVLWRGRRLALAALAATGLAGVSVVALVVATDRLAIGMSPLWFTVACAVAAPLLAWTHLLRAGADRRTARV
ncbi:hypothetical protein AB0K18_24220 [Nonomuraea sp. NPDC049421]|uniref:hypothetical protein n=1 Tax=Nonomuraea sp. NPDC049421 TaxID=3155275 RepID=UPI00344A5939